MAYSEEQRVLPSNASPEICPKFNNGNGGDCGPCLEQDICSTCLQRDHPASSCKAAVSDVDYEYPRHEWTPEHNRDVKVFNDEIHRLPSELRGNCPIFSAQHAIKIREADREWPDASPWFRARLRNFEHNPVEWKSPKYVQYREKQKGIKEKNKHNPWPDDIEYHFQRGTSSL